MTKRYSPSRFHATLGGGLALPRTGLLFRALVANGLSDDIGLSVSDAPLIDPALWSTFFALDGEGQPVSVLDAATIIANIQASPLLDIGTLVGTAAKGYALYAYNTADAVLTNAYNYFKLTSPADILAASGVSSATSIRSISFQPTIVAGQDYTVPVGGELILHDGTVKTAGTYQWPADVSWCSVRGTSSTFFGISAVFSFVFNGVVRAFTVTTETGDDLTFTTVGYNAAWTPPSIIAALLADANVTWRKPDGTTFTGKAPAMTNFSQTGQYRCHVTDWSKATALGFAPGAPQSFVSLINFDVMLPYMTGLNTLTFRDMSSFSGDVTNWVFPTSLTTLPALLYNCVNAVGNITGWQIPVGVTDLNYSLTGNSYLTGTLPNLSLCASTSYEVICYNSPNISGDLSTWTMRTNITRFRFHYSRLTYGTGGALRSNVRNGLIFSMDNYLLSSAAVGRILIDINMSGATGVGGSINVNTNDGAPDWGTEASPSDVAYAVADLIYKNWTSITVTGGIPAWVSVL